MNKNDIDVSTLNELISLMQKNNLNSLSVDELLIHVNSLKVSSSSITSCNGEVQCRHSEENDETSNTRNSNSTTSPTFSFKTPTKLFSPIKLSDSFAQSCAVNEHGSKANSESNIDPKSFEINPAAFLGSEKAKNIQTNLKKGPLSRKDKLSKNKLLATVTKTNVSLTASTGNFSKPLFSFPVSSTSSSSTVTHEAQTSELKFTFNVKTPHSKMPSSGLNGGGSSFVDQLHTPLSAMSLDEVVYSPKNGSEQKENLPPRAGTGASSSNYIPSQSFPANTDHQGESTTNVTGVSSSFEDRFSSARDVIFQLNLGTPATQSRGGGKKKALHLNKFRTKTAASSNASSPVNGPQAAESTSTAANATQYAPLRHAVAAVKAEVQTPHTSVSNRQTRPSYDGMDVSFTPAPGYRLSNTPLQQEINSAAASAPVFSNTSVPPFNLFPNPSSQASASTSKGPCSDPVNAASEPPYASAASTNYDKNTIATNPSNKQAPTSAVVPDSSLENSFAYNTGSNTVSSTAHEKVASTLSTRRKGSDRLGLNPSVRHSGRSHRHCHSMRTRSSFSRHDSSTSAPYCGSVNDDDDDDDGDWADLDSSKHQPPCPPNDQNETVIAEITRLWELGKTQYNGGLYQDASASFTNALKQAEGIHWPHVSKMLGNRAAALYMQGLYLEAVDDCQAALLLDPDLPKLLLRAGRAQLKLGHLAQAEEYFNKINSYIYSCSVEESASLGDIVKETRLEKRSISAARAAMTDMSRYESVGSYEAALRQAETLLTICPCSLVAHVSKSKALNKLHQYSAAMKHLASILNSIAPSLLRLHAHSAAKFPPPATSTLSWTTRTDLGGQIRLTYDCASSSTAILCLGEELGQEYFNCLKNSEHSHVCCGDVIDACQSVLTLVKTQALNMPTWRWVDEERQRGTTLLERKRTADCLFREGRFLESAACYAEAIKTDPYVPRWHAVLMSNRAAAHMRLGLYSAAVDDCHQALASDPEYVRAHLRRARAFAARKEYSNAARDLRRYIDSDPLPPDRAEVQAELAALLAEQKQYAASTQRDRQHQYTESQRQHTYGADEDDEWVDEDDDFPFHNRRQHPSHSRGPSGSQSQSNGRNTGNGNGKSNSQHSQHQQQRQQQPNHTHSHHDRGQNSHNGHRQPGSAGKDPVKSAGDGDHYETLGVSCTASYKELRQAYHKLVLKYHPDKTREAGTEEKFRKVSEAYQVLVDPRLRLEYDRSQKSR